MSDLRSAVKARGIRRLCHFTPSRNLAHIIAGGEGVLASRTLTKEERDVFNPTDLQRLDGHLDHVCCSIEYPNAWYFRKARAEERIFRDWVVLFLSPELLLRPGAKFSARNAAAAGGRFVVEGHSGFEAMYAARVDGAYGNTYVRGADRSPAIPTDEQAEVLIPNGIPFADIIGVAVRDEEQAKLEVERLRMQRLPRPRFFIAPLFYDANGLSSSIRSGEVPDETAHDAAE